MGPQSSELINQDRPAYSVQSRRGMEIPEAAGGKL